jgi:hypothetical protein
VTLEALTSLMSPADATAAWERSAELRGLLAQITHEHGINRALMRQELAFLDHLTRIMGAAPDTGYRPPSETVTPTAPRAIALRTLDLQA